MRLECAEEVGIAGGAERAHHPGAPASGDDGGAGGGAARVDLSAEAGAGAQGHTIFVDHANAPADGGAIAGAADGAAGSPGHFAHGDDSADFCVGVIGEDEL